MNPRSPAARWVRTLGLDANPLGAAVLLVLLATVLVSAIVLLPMLRTTTDAPTAPSAARDPGRAIAAFDDGLSRQVTMIDGRSLFAIPPKPSEVPTGPRPTVYAGPAIIAFVNGTAWFADGQKISADAPKGSSLELVRADPPWSIRVKWQGAEFDVELFKKVPLSSLIDTSKPSTNLWTPLSGSAGRAGDDGRAPAMGPFGPLPEIATRRSGAGPSMPAPGAIPPAGAVFVSPPHTAVSGNSSTHPAPGEPQRSGNGGGGGGGDAPQGGSPAPAPAEPGTEPAPSHPEPEPASPAPNPPSTPPSEPSEP